jgi:hypothetical protein
MVRNAKLLEFNSKKNRPPLGSRDAGCKKMLKERKRTQSFIANKGLSIVSLAKTNCFWSGKGAPFGQKTLLFDT